MYWRKNKANKSIFCETALKHTATGGCRSQKWLQKRTVFIQYSNYQQLLQATSGSTLCRLLPEATRAYWPRFFFLFKGTLWATVGVGNTVSQIFSPTHWASHKAQTWRETDCTTGIHKAVMIQVIFYLNRHSAFGQHSLCIKNFYWGISRSRSYQLSVSAIRSYTTRSFMRCDITSLVFRSLRRHGLYICIKFQVNSCAWSYRIWPSDCVLNSTVIVLHSWKERSWCT